ncbi:Phosphopantothenate--cysteine ligase, partial [Reticulomyxa filosa]
SSEGSLELKLSNTPKMLGYFRHLLEKRNEANSGRKASNMLVSFKLETKLETEFLFKKAKEAIRKYGSDVVCSNILSTRYREVWMVTPSAQIHVTQDRPDVEIESDIVQFVNNLLQSTFNCTPKCRL